VDWGITRWLTVAVDLFGTETYNAQRIRLLSAPPVLNQGVNVTYPTISPYTDSYWKGDVSAGIKLRPIASKNFKNLIVTGNALWRLNNAGLRSAVVPLVAVSYTF